MSAMLNRMVTRRTVLKGSGATVAGVLLAPFGGRVRAGTLASPPLAAPRIAGVTATLPRLRSAPAPLHEPRSLLTRPITAAVEPDASGLHYTRAEGYFPNRGSATGILRSTEVVAFEAHESRLGIDLDGDGDTSQGGIFYLHRPTGMIRFTGIERGSLRGATDRWIVFVTTEAVLGEDYNGDGIIDDAPIPGFFDVETGQVAYLRVPRLRHEFYDPAWIRVSGNRIVFRCAERPEIAYYDLATGELVYTPAVGRLPAIDGDRIAYVTSDSTLAFYDIVDDKISDTRERLVGADSPTDVELTVAGDWIVYRNYERFVGKDLDGDGRLDEVIGIWHVTSGELRYLPASAGSTIVANNRMYLTELVIGAERQVTGHRVGYRDLFSDEVRMVDLPVRPRLIAANDDGVLVAVRETAARRDLNGDGRISQQLIAAFVSLPRE